MPNEKQTVVQQLDAANAQILQLTNSVAALTQQRDDAIKATETLKADHAAIIEKVNAAATKASNDLAAEIAAHGATKKDLEKAQHALAHPAFADAAARGEMKPTPEGGAAQVAHVMTNAEHMTEYKRIRDSGNHVEAAAYRTKFAKELGIA